MIDQILRAEYSVCKLAIENKDLSRFYSIQHLVDILQINLFQQGRIKDEYIDKFISSHLFEITQLINRQTHPC